MLVTQADEDVSGFGQERDGQGHVRSKASVCEGFASVSEAGKWAENVRYGYYLLLIQYKYFYTYFGKGFWTITS